MFDKIGGVLFGESGYEQQEMLTPAQIEARQRQIDAMSQGVTNSGEALAGYTSEGYNSYNQAKGDEQFDRMGRFLKEDAMKQKASLKGGPMSRFSTASNKLSGDISRGRAQGQLGLDQARLSAITSAGQNAYTNQMNAMQQALGSNASMLGSSNQIQKTQSAGLLDMLGGGSQTMGMISQMMGGE